MSARISLTIEQFGDVTDRSGMRGVAVKATSRFASLRVFSHQLPAVYFSDAGDVEVGDVRLPLKDFIEWVRAIESEATRRAGLCATCSEPDGGLTCAQSRRSCGHHCNHSWTDDACHWCGVEFGEMVHDGDDQPTPPDCPDLPPTGSG